MKNKIKIERVKKSLSQKQLANKIGISQATISDIEKGKKGVILSVAFKIANFFGVKIEDLFN